MEIYIDQQNLLSFWKGRESQPLFSDGLKLLKTQMDINFNFSKGTAANTPELAAIIPQFTTGMGAKTKQAFLNEPYPDRNPFKPNFHGTHTNCHSIFWLDEEEAPKAKAQGALLIAGVGEEYECIERIFLQKGDYCFARSLPIGKAGFERWDDLAGYIFPTKDIIIVDNFILNDKSLIESNFQKILKILHGGITAKTNIILFTQSHKRPTDFSDIRSWVNSAVQPILGKKPNFTLVDTSSEHDRTILTSYLRIKSGDSFNYFRSNGTKCTKGKEIDLVSLSDSDNLNLFSVTISDLQAIIDKGVNIHGDKKSNLLKFS